MKGLQPGALEMEGDPGTHLREGEGVRGVREVYQICACRDGSMKQLLAQVPCGL